MIKKVFASLFAVVILLCAVGCGTYSEVGKKADSSTSMISDDSGSQPSDDGTDQTDTTESGDESGDGSGDGSDTSEQGDGSDDSGSEDGDKIERPDTSNMKKILFLGNSHAKDTYMALPEIFRAEGYTDYTFGLAYYGQQDIADHASYIGNDSAVYTYFLSKPDVQNGKIRTPNGKTDGNYNLVTFESILTDQEWDIVFIQVCMRDVVLSDDVYASSRQTVVNFIRSKAPDAKIGTSCSWLAPYSDDPNASPGKWANIAVAYNNYGTTPADHCNRHCKVMKDNIVKDATYCLNIDVCTPVFYANQVLEISSDVLYRDVAHMSQFGRGLVSYSFFAQYTGAEIEEIKLDSLSGYVAPSGTNALTLTVEQKNIIKASANYAFNSPWTVPSAE